MKKVSNLGGSIKVILKVLHWAVILPPCLGQAATKAPLISKLSCYHVSVLVLMLHSHHQMIKAKFWAKREEL